jgi:UDP-N-acetylmuramate--alanine ligase
MKKIGIMGICGIGMSAIAQFFNHQGNQVFGSDSNYQGKRAQELREKAIEVYSEEDFLAGEKPDFIIKSSGILENNKALKRAKDLQIPILTRKEALAKITENYDKVLAVAGTHGKTTSTTLLAEFFTNLGLNPTVFCGGIMAFCNNNLKLGCEEILILEADESDGTFLEIKRNLALITNINWDHVDFFPSFEAIKEAFELFVNKSEKFLIPNSEAKKIPSFTPYLTFGLKENNTISARSIQRIGDELAFELLFQDKSYPCQIKSPAKHNISNALGVLGMALALGLEPDTIIPTFQKTLANFQGVARRLNYLPKNQRTHLTVLDDYAHHPNEIKLTIESVKDKNTLIVVWQPHRFTRIQAFLEEFLEVFYDADYLLVSEIYSGGEEAIPGLSGKFLVEELLKRSIKVFFTPDEAAVAKKLDQIALPGDTLLFLGAGSISDWAKNFS